LKRQKKKKQQLPNTIKESIAENFYHRPQHISGVICMDKKCAVCKKPFITFDNKKKYCSDQCAKKAGKK
jgi:hypothetical protein